MKRLFIAAVVAVSLAVPASAFAWTKSQATSAAQGWQIYQCGESPYSCVNANLIASSCHGPTGGGIQWTCEGSTISKRGSTIYFCTIESSWSAYGNLVHDYRS